MDEHNEDFGLDRDDELLQGWNGASTDYRAESCLQALFEEQVTKNAEAIAIVQGARALTYAELNARANACAHTLRACGVGIGDRVAILLDRSIELVVAELAIVKCGAAYVPLDTTFPQERLAFLMADSGAKAVIADREVCFEGVTRFDVDADGPHENLGVSVDSASLAYVMYTSGSTGQPKGVMVPQGAVQRLVLNNGYAELRAGDRVAFSSNPAFDATTFEVWAPLLNGCAIVVIERNALLDPRVFREALLHHGVTVLWMTVGLFNQYVQSGELEDAFAALRYLITGGDALDATVIARVLRGRAPQHLVNGYGPTESTTFAITHEIREVAPGARSIPIGRPIANTRVYLLDERMEPVPTGMAGEIYIGGAGVALGYLNRPELTRERFLTDPFAADGTRMYKTGDLGRRRADGVIEFLGRNDAQVKIRGFRVEPGEIETCLLEWPGVREAVVVAREAEAGEKRLVAYVAAPEPLGVEALRRFLEERLPAAMVPAAYVRLDVLPLTANGKIDRAALPAPDAHAVAQSSYEAPRGELETVVAGVWSELLAVEHVGRNDRLLSLGGDSLLAVRIANRIQERLGLAAPIGAVLSSSVEELACELRPRGIPAQSTSTSAASNEYPATLSQQQVHFFSELHRHARAYQTQSVMRIRGPLDVPRLQRALNAIVERHEHFRTTYQSAPDGTLVGCVHAAASGAFRIEDLPSAHTLDENIRREVAVVIDPAVLPLVRWILFRLADDDHALLMIEHHHIHDGWSFRVYLRELAALYGEPAAFLPAPMQFREHALQQQQQLTGGTFPALQEAWRAHLDGFPHELRLAVAAKTQASTLAGDQLRIALPAPLSDAVRDAAAATGATPFQFLFAAFAILISRYSAQTRFLLGSSTANRDALGSESVIGMLVNAIAVPVDLDGAVTFEDALSAVRVSLLRSMQLGQLPFPEVVRAVAAERSRDVMPLVQVAFNAHNSLDKNVRLDGLELELVEALPNGTAKFDLSIITIPGKRGEATELLFEFNERFDRGTIEQLARQYRHFLERAAAGPSSALSALPLLDAEERHELVHARNATSDFTRAESLQELFEAQVERTPEATALVFEQQTLTYAALNARANQLAHYLRARGVQRDDRVALALHRGLDMIAGILGVLKAGGAYVPLDPDSPPERIAHMLRDCEPVVVLTDDAWSEAAWSQQPASNPEAVNQPNDLAYVIYTSGSTGVPKGVMVEHANVTRLLAATEEWYGFDEHDVWPLFHSYAFDVSVWEIWGALLYGGRLVVVPQQVTRAPEELYALVRSEGVTVLNQTPSAFRQFIPAQSDQEHRLRLIILAGEALEVATLAPWFARNGERTRVVNMYGITETTVHSTYQPVTGEDALRGGSPIGCRIPDLRIYLLDEQCEPVPPGVAGELYVGGAGVARGYLNRPELTAQRFLRDPFAGTPGARMYRSGDLARFRSDGTLEFLGRNDFQVKIRGFRIELGEIEARLLEHPAIGEAVVLSRDERLVAYFVGENVAASELRAHLSASLPEYMIPAAYVRLERFPLTTNGKLDRKALPDAEAGAFALRAYREPEGEIETLVARIWSELLGLDRPGLQGVGRHDDFFELGGHSLLAVRMIAQLRRLLGIEVSLGLLFDQPVLADFAGCLTSAPATTLPSIVPATEGRELLSFAQRRLWFLAQLDGDNGAYHTSLPLRLTGTLDHQALRKALDAQVARHESLRTTFTVVDGEPVQRFGDASARFTCVEHDLRACPEELPHWREEEARAPFDLEHGPLIRGRLLRLADDEHLLLITLHHIISDGWSLEILLRDLGLSYGAFSTGASNPLAPLPIQYADYAAWQRRWMSGEVLQQQAAYWKEELAGAPAILKLPADRVRPAEQDHAGAWVKVTLDPGLTNGIRAFSQRHGVTLYMTLLASWAAVLSRLSGQDEVVIGSPVANRGRMEVEDLIGFFVNTLALRIDVSGSPTVRELLARVKTQILAAQEHQDIPFEQVVEIARPVRSLAHSPVFQVMLAWQNAPEVTIQLPGLTLASATNGKNATAKFDLMLGLREAGQSIVGEIEYATALFERSTIERYLGHWQTLLRAMLADDEEAVDRLALLTSAERDRLVEEGNETAADYPREKCIHELFESQVEKTPDSVAVVYEDLALTYDALNGRANQLAHYLRELGVKPDDRVAVCLERGVEMVVGVLAVLKAGGAYVPLDPAYPAERLAYMVRDSEPVVLLTQLGLADKWSSPDGEATSMATLVHLDAPAAPWADRPSHNTDCLRIGLTPENLAYTIYTSGSTGRPKGVAMPHGALVNLLWWQIQKSGAASPPRTLQFAALGFDVAFQEIFSTLCAGGELVLVREDLRRNAGELLAFIRSRRIERLFLPYVALSALAEVSDSTDAPMAGSSLREVIVAGEQLQIDGRISRLLSTGDCKLQNQYGPTETHVVTAFDLPAGRAQWPALPPIGRPIANTRIYLLDRHGEPVPAGVTGEIHVSGAGLARGYLQRPEATAEVFTRDPWNRNPDARMYRTGDLGRYLPDGNIEFLGRNDFQVKIRGFRIEPGEIEACLLQHPSVRSAAVVAREDVAGDKRLVAYVVPRDGVTAEELRAFAAKLLPEFMMPAAYVRLERLPLTASGKLDRRALPMPGTDAYVKRAYLPPQGTTETTLARIWSDLLRVGPVGRHDDFFELGGHSMLLTRLLLRIRGELDVDLSMREVFLRPVLSALSERIVDARLAQFDPEELRQLMAGAAAIASEKGAAND